MWLWYNFGMKKTIELPQSLPESHALIISQQEEIVQLQARYRQVLEQFKLAQQRNYARSSESNVLQLELQFDEADSVPPQELPKEEDNTITVTYTKSKPKRRPLPDNLIKQLFFCNFDLTSCVSD